LHSIYRKIEIKMERAGYPNILLDVDLTSEETVFKKVFHNLQVAKREYKSINTSDFLNTYSIYKKLFFRYIDYITCSLENERDMDERDRLPATIEEIGSCLKELNTWMPVKSGEKWLNYTGSFICSPTGYKKDIKRLVATRMFSEYLGIDDNKVAEPYIEKEFNKKALFGFVDMIGAEEARIPYDSTVLEIE